jgi:cobalt-zinc-cadmium resistance protein CzcA
LPAGIKLIPFYDQSKIIDGTIRTVRGNLIEAGLLVSVVLIIFLGNLRAALLVALVIPLSMLFGFIGMAAFGVSANLMSLGAIDFGMIVDGSVVMVEHFVVRLSNSRTNDRKSEIRAAAHEVARPILFAVMIIIAVYLPIFTLQGMEGRMFRPMAITVCSALAGSLFFALTLIPGLSSLVLRSGTDRLATGSGHSVDEGGWFVRLRDRYGASLDWAIERRFPVLVGAAGVLAIALVSLLYIGTEFMPRLDEGSILITSRRLPGIAISESLDIGRQIERVMLSFPEVKSVVTKLGRPDLATEAMGVDESDSYLTLSPSRTWKCCRTKEELAGKLSTALARIPGVSYTFSQPMEMRMDEQITGVRGDVAIKIFGDDINVLQDLAARTLRAISSVPGAFNPQMEMNSAVRTLQIQVNRSELARYGLNVSDVGDMVQSLIGGKQVSEMILGQQRFSIAVRLPESQRNDIDGFGNLSLIAPGG